MKFKFQPMVAALALCASVSVQASLIVTGYESGSTKTTLVDDPSLQYQTVGGYEVDSILAYAELINSSDDTESGWMSAVFDELGITMGDLSLDKIEFGSDDDVDNFWKHVDDTIYNGEVDFEPEYYLIKIGGGLLDAEHFLYQNRGGQNDLTIDLDWIEKFSGFTGKNFDIYRISHVSTNKATSVPEPALWLLFGSGMIGLGIARRTRRR
jgi:hypothetical protein